MKFSSHILNEAICALSALTLGSVPFLFLLTSLTSAQLSASHANPLIVRAVKRWALNNVLIVNT